MRVRRVMRLLPVSSLSTGILNKYMSTANTSNKLLSAGTRLGLTEAPSSRVTLSTKMAATIGTGRRLEAWVGFIRSHAAITRQLNVDLLNAHGLTLNDYEVLLVLSRADDGMMRRVDLAESVLLTASGITRLLDGLEQAGYVE